MKLRYFQSAWEDIKHTKGWFGKIVLLALIAFIPIVGFAIILSYLYGWAREIAWGVHEPAPRKIFSNPDGHFWERGWFILLVVVIYALIPSILYGISGSIDSATYEWTFFGPQIVSDPLLEGVKNVINIVAFILSILLSVMAWIGSMRVAIYNRLSAGFQIKKIWTMLRHDAGGIVRIYLMELLFAVIFGIILTIVFVVFIGIIFAVGYSVLDASGYFAYMQTGSPQAYAMLFQVILASGAIGILLLLLAMFLTSICAVFTFTLLVRAMGYWTMQFNVPLWGGQDDPLPFQLQEPPEALRAQAPVAPGTPDKQNGQESDSWQ